MNKSPLPTTDRNVHLGNPLTLSLTFEVIPYPILPLLDSVGITPFPLEPLNGVIVSPSVPSLISPNENDTVEMEPCFLISLKHPLPSSHLTGARRSPVSLRSGPQHRLSSSTTPAPGPSPGLPRRRRCPDPGGRRRWPDLGSLRPAQPGHGHHQRCVPAVVEVVGVCRSLK